MSSEDDRHVEVWIEAEEIQRKKDMDTTCKGCPVYLGDYYECPYGGLGESCIYS